MADKKKTSSAKKPTLGAFLQQTPETVVYGELFEGIKFGFADLGRVLQEAVFERVVARGIPPYSEAKSKVAAWESKNKTSHQKTCEPQMAMIRGYRHAHETVALQEPTLLLVLGQGEKARDGGTRFSVDGCLM